MRAGEGSLTPPLISPQGGQEGDIERGGGKGGVEMKIPQHAACLLRNRRDIRVNGEERGQEANNTLGRERGS